MKKMISDNNLVRHLAACETMGGVTNICSDKTGTLTTNRMEVTEAWITGVKYDAMNQTSAQSIKKEIADLLCESIAVNSQAHLSVKTASVELKEAMKSAGAVQDPNQEKIVSLSFFF